ncbi:MAG: Co2+/Mg2+ efflux protein ApaG [Anaeromyxobacteraceae bacterium]
MSTATTDGIEVSVASEFRPDRSTPAQGRYLFTYTVRIVNVGSSPARLMSRHWIITDARGEREEVRGEGVIGQQPHLAPGQSFQYTSFCVLRTPLGQMLGTYTMSRDDGTRFEADIAPFALAVPAALN